MPAFACRLALPADFRVADFLAFHARDAQQLAERVGPQRIVKGLHWQGRPARLEIVFAAGRADACLQAERAPPATFFADLLGLGQPVAAFEAAHRAHPVLGPLLAAQAGLRVPQAATAFEALSWAITGQQISLAAALSLRRGLIRAAGAVHADGLACYPDAAAVARLDEAALHGAGFSRSKAETLVTLARHVEDGRLPLEAWRAGTPAAEIRAALLALRGIGPWTVDYTLLRGFAWLDGSLHGDAAVRRALQALLGRPLGPAEAAAWLAEFAPWRALVAAHLWAWGAGRPQPKGG